MLVVVGDNGETKKIKKKSCKTKKKKKKKKKKKRKRKQAAHRHQTRPKTNSHNNKYQHSRPHFFKIMCVLAGRLFIFSSTLISHDDLPMTNPIICRSRQMSRKKTQQKSVLILLTERTHFSHVTLYCRRF